jgi:type II secretory pathway component PulC
MKSKKMTYVIAVVTAILWGAIIYRVIAAMSGDQLPVTFAEPHARERYDEYKLPKETTKLHTGYRDPFGMTTTKIQDTTTIKPKLAATRPISVVAAVPAINWGIFNYRGYVRNAGSRKLIAVISVNGKEMMLSEGESVGQVKLLKNMRDSVKIYYQGKTKFITLNTAAL